MFSLTNPMKCQNCEASILPSDERCPRCGAIPLHRRAFFGAKEEEFALTPDEESVELDDRPEAEDWQFPYDQQKEKARFRASEESQSSADNVLWGGFFRRVGAFVVDVLVILALSAVMFFLTYVGYKVGLSAHGRFLTWENATPLVVLLTWAWIGLATTYFVVFHGLEGKTVGKWLLRLRVVGPERGPISYRRAFLRWLALVGFAPVLLGFLWVLWSREKRGWHDLVARTWVIID
jgi:uncharacterized RDD family membrane protein YckC